MNRRIVYSLLLVCLSSFPVAIIAQDEAGFDLMKDDISKNIPPLEVLIDSAIAQDPYILFRDLQVIVNDCKLKASKVDWTRNVGVQTDIRYGNYYNYSINSSGGIDPPPVATTRNETKYGAALYLNLPFYTLVNRRNQIKLATAEIDQAQQMAYVQRNEKRQLIIKQYNALILSQRLIRIKAKYLETSNLNMLMVEKQFSNGVISVTEYARISEIVTRITTDYENARMDFLTNYMILEELVGMKFNLTNSLSETNEGN